MKSYTNIEQSRKLAEILPLESADMWFANGLIVAKTSEEPKDIKGVFPCWSLAALLEELPDELTTDDGIDYSLTICKENLQYYLYYHDSWGTAEDIETNYYDAFVDACYEMIIKLNEQKIL